MLFIKPAAPPCADVVGHTAFDTLHGIQPARVRDIGGLRSPGRNCAQPWHYQQQMTLFGNIGRRRTVGEDAFEDLALRGLQCNFQCSEMPVFRSDSGDGGCGSLEGLGQLLEAEFRQGVAPAQRQKFWHLGIGESLKRNYSLPVV